MRKELLQKYKNLKTDTTTIKKYKTTKIETTKLEREFPIEVIASIFESRLFAPLEEIEDFVCFITNENVDLSNIQRFIPTIQSEILKQHPTLKTISLHNYEICLTPSRVEYTKEWYREQNGNSLTIKSLKKGYTKVLTIQDK